MVEISFWRFCSVLAAKSPKSIGYGNELPVLRELLHDFCPEDLSLVLGEYIAAFAGFTGK